MGRAVLPPYRPGWSRTQLRLAATMMSNCRCRCWWLAPAEWTGAARRPSVRARSAGAGRLQHGQGLSARERCRPDQQRSGDGGCGDLHDDAFSLRSRRFFRSSLLLCQRGRGAVGRGGTKLCAFRNKEKSNSGVVDEKRIAFDLISGHRNGFDLDPPPRRLFYHNDVARLWIAAPYVMDNGISFVERFVETIQQNVKFIESIEVINAHFSGRFENVES